MVTPMASIRSVGRSLSDSKLMVGLHQVLKERLRVARPLFGVHLQVRWSNDLSVGSFSKGMDLCQYSGAVSSVSVEFCCSRVSGVRSWPRLEAVERIPERMSRGAAKDSFAAPQLLWA
jgi:hypothetical protein